MREKHLRVEVGKAPIFSAKILPIVKMDTKRKIREAVEIRAGCFRYQCRHTNRAKVLELNLFHVLMFCVYDQLTVIINFWTLL